MAVVSKGLPAGRQGFTLLELLVTISIIGILMAVVSVSLSTAQKKGRDVRRKGDITAIQKSLEQCYSIDGEYLTDANVSFGSSLTCTAGQIAMNQVPEDPKPDTYSYTYKPDVDNTKYCLCAALENLGTGNANTTGSGGDCTFLSDSNYFCVSSQQ